MAEAGCDWEFIEVDIAGKQQQQQQQQCLCNDYNHPLCAPFRRQTGNQRPRASRLRF
jgi:hypothetical protein